MNSQKSLFTLCLVTACLPASAVSFSEAMQELEVKNPEVFFHLNLKDDFTVAGNLINRVYQARAALDPETPPIPVDFAKAFVSLGLAQLTSISYSSEAASDNSGFVNQAMMTFDSPPEGLFKLYGAANRSFDAAPKVPADTDLLIDASLNFSSILEIVMGISRDVMGEMGPQLIQAQLATPILPDGSTIADLINMLSTKIVFAGRLTEATDAPSVIGISGDFVLQVDGVGTLVPTLMAMAQAQGNVVLQPEDSDLGPAWYLRFNNMPVGMRLLLQVDSTTDDLYVTLARQSLDWLSGAADSLAESPDYIAKSAGLPTAGLVHSFASEKVSQLSYSQFNQMDLDPATMAVMAIIQSEISKHSGPEASTMYIDGNSLRVRANQPMSSKTGLGLAVASALAFIDFNDLFGGDSEAIEDDEMPASE